MSNGFVFIDYAVSKECKNPESMGCICVKCGECGRKFEDGFMVDSGGTHPDTGAEDE